MAYKKRGRKSAARGRSTRTYRGKQRRSTARGRSQQTVRVVVEHRNTAPMDPVAQLNEALKAKPRGRSRY